MTTRVLTDEEIQQRIDGKVTIVQQGRIPMHEGVQLFEKEYIGKAKSSADAALALAVSAFEDDRRGERAYVRSIVLMGVDFEHVCVLTAALRPAPMTYSQALEKLKDKQRLARAGWNGAGQYVYLVEGLRHGEIEFEPVFVIRNAQGKHQPGWLASMGDQMAGDWEIVN
jgi:hypothetical protein